MEKNSPIFDSLCWSPVSMSLLLSALVLGLVLSLSFFLCLFDTSVSTMSSRGSLFLALGAVPPAPILQAPPDPESHPPGAGVDLASYAAPLLLLGDELGGWLFMLTFRDDEGSLLLLEPGFIMPREEDFDALSALLDPNQVEGLKKL